MSDQPEPPELDVTIPIPDGLRVTGEEPYRILVIGDYAGSADGSLSGPLAEGVVDVTADTFDEVLATASPGVSFTINDPIASGNVMVEIGLKFDALRAFSPKELVGQIPAARALMGVREQIVARMLGKLSPAELSGAVAQAVSSDAALSWLVDAVQVLPDEPTAEPAEVDALLGQIDLGDDTSDEAKPPTKSPVGSLVSAAAGTSGGLSANESSALRRALAELDRRISAWLNAVMHLPQVQRLESAWRGLAFAVARIDFRKGVRLSILHAPPKGLVERFSSRVIDPVFDEGVDAPDLIAVDAQFGNAASDLEALDELAQHAASLPAVVLAGASAGFFGVKHTWQIATLPSLNNTFDQWQFAKWKSLRNQAYAKHLALVFGRCLLRMPHRRDGGPELEFAFREQDVTEKDFVWTTGSLAAACLVARSVATTGWPAAVSGLAHGKTEDLPIAQGGKKGDKQFGPTDSQTPQAKISEMGMVGVNAMAPLGSEGSAVFCNGMTAARPRRADPSAIFEVSLPYMLFAGRISALLWALKPALEQQSSDRITGYAATHVAAWLGLDADSASGCISAQVREAEDDPGALQLALTVTPPQTLVPGGVPLVLGYKFTPR